MQFRAVLRRTSPVYTHWSYSFRLGGEAYRPRFQNVRFCRKGEDFVSVGELTDEEIVRLRDSPHIILEVTALPCAVSGVSPSLITK